MESAGWTAVAAGVQAAATVVLVIVTVRYVRLVGEQAEAAEESARATKRSAEATEHMAKLQAREARQEAVTTLNELSKKLSLIWNKLGDWKHNSPSWDQMRSGASGGKVDLTGGMIEDAREMIHGAVWDDDLREELINTINRAATFMVAAKEAESSSPAADVVNNLQESYEPLRKDLGAGKRKVDELLMSIGTRQ